MRQDTTKLQHASFCFILFVYPVLTGCVLGVAPAGAASFDCAKAATPVEKLICADPRLSEMDLELDRSYQKARESEKLLNNKDRLREYQAAWLRDIRNRCLDLKCLKAVYEQRIVQLKVPLQPDNCHGADQGDMGAIANCNGSEWHMEEDYLNNLTLILKKTQIDSQILTFEKKQSAWRKNFECHCLSKLDGYTAGSLGPAMVVGCRLEGVKLRVSEVRKILNGAPVNFGGDSPPPGSCRQKNVLHRDGVDLILALDQGSNQLRVLDYFATVVGFADSYYRIERITFGDGTAWNEADIAARIQSGSVNAFTGTAGNDTYIVDNALDTISEPLNGGIDTILSAVSYTNPLPANVENLTLTGFLNLNATGNELDNVITGNRGNNRLNAASAGSFGVNGRDTLIGGAGDDFYTLGSSGGIVIENAGCPPGTKVPYTGYRGFVSVDATVWKQAA